MELSNRELKELGQALSYAVLYAKTEPETAEFALLKMKIEREIVKREQIEKRKAEHAKTGCPPCKISCHHNPNQQAT